VAVSLTVYEIIIIIIIIIIKYIYIAQDREKLQMRWYHPDKWFPQQDKMQPKYVHCPNYCQCLPLTYRIILLSRDQLFAGIQHKVFKPSMLWRRHPLNFD